MKTGVASVKLAIAGFIVPFMFVYAPQLMLIDTTLTEGLWVAASASVGVVLIAAAVEGYLMAPIAGWLRVVAAAGSLLLIKPGLETDAVGLVVLVLLILVQKKKANTPAAC